MFRLLTCIYKCLLFLVDDLVIEALKEGFQQAQKLLIGCNMGPSREARNKKWWTDPWAVEEQDQTFMHFKRATELVAGEDGDGEVMREVATIKNVNVAEDINVVEGVNDAEDTNAAEDVETEEFDDRLDPVLVAQEEVKGIFDEMLSLGSEETDLVDVKPNVSVTVRFESNVIYKSTLVSQLNVNPFLSKDRLTRVKSSVYFNNYEAYLSAAECANTCLIGLGSDVGIFFVQRVSLTRSSSVKTALRRHKGKGGCKGVPASIVNGADEGMWWIGRIQKMRKKVVNRWGISRQPTDLLNKPTTTTMVLLNYFSKFRGHLKFKYDVTDSKWIDIDSIISSVTLTFDRTQNVYTLNDVDAQALNDFVSTK